jgi:hypothetical protein
MEMHGPVTWTELTPTIFPLVFADLRYPPGQCFVHNFYSFTKSSSTIEMAE